MPTRRAFGRWQKALDLVLAVAPAVREQSSINHQTLNPSTFNARLSSIDSPYLRVNVSSMVISTGTACPWRMPGAKRHCRAAFTAS